MKRVAFPFVAIFALVGLLFAATPLGLVNLGDDPLQYLFSDEPLSLGQALLLARELHALAEATPMPDLPRSDSAPMAAMLEIAPYFEDEGIATGTAYPLVVFNLNRGMRNFHVLGTYYIMEGVIALNLRYINPMSRWYINSNLFATMVHEIAHAQGVYAVFDPLSEPTAQLATLEVLAAMSRDQNPWAFPSFVRELAGYADDYALYLALQTGQMDQYRAYYESIADNEWERGGLDRMLWDWREDMDQLKSILYAYGSVPFQLLTDTLSHNPAYTPELRAVPNSLHIFCANDAKWVVLHLRALVRDYNQVKRWETE